MAGHDDAEEEGKERREGIEADGELGLWFLFWRCREGEREEIA